SCGYGIVDQDQLFQFFLKFLILIIGIEDGRVAVMGEDISVCLHLIFLGDPVVFIGVFFGIVIGYKGNRLLRMSLSQHVLAQICQVIIAVQSFFQLVEAGKIKGS